MAASNWIVYDIFKVNIGNEIYDMGGDSFKCMLMTSGYTPNLANHEVYTSSGVSSSEVGTTNTGYTLGGQVISGLSWTESGSTTACVNAGPESRCDRRPAGEPTYRNQEARMK